MLLLLALGQTPEAPAPSDLRAELSQATDIAVSPSAERRQLEYEQEVWCAQLKPSTAVPSGKYRVQCNDEKRECLVAPEKVLIDGIEGEEDAARTRLCLPLYKDDRLLTKAQQGFTFVEAVAEAPDGWYRDERGRIIQVNFDLHRRVYFGGGWAPQYSQGAGFLLGRARADFGVELDLDNNGGRELHRLRLLQGSVSLGDNPSVDAALVSYSWGVQRVASPLWITTFVGHPRRFDLDVNVSGWFEALRWELVQGNSFLTLGTAAVTLDFWRSRSLDSYIRLRAGPSAEYDLQSKTVSLKPIVALDADLTLDRDGFHHLTAMASAEKLFFDQALFGRTLNPERLRFQLGYEVILLAINDYPLTLVIDTRATWRDDLPAIKPGWEFSANAGLRFSFWAPARRDAGKVQYR
jgi:hypothetical protein